MKDGCDPVTLTQAGNKIPTAWRRSQVFTKTPTGSQSANPFKSPAPFI